LKVKLKREKIKDLILVLYIREVIKVIYIKIIRLKIVIKILRDLVYSFTLVK